MLEHHGLQLLESCSFHWIFDIDGRRFRRTPRNAGVLFDVSAGWTRYAHLEIDHSRSCFVVDLDEDGTRVLRAWLHTEPCERCGGKLSLHRLRPKGGWAQPKGVA